MSFNPHDSFFRETFCRKEVAAGFLREYLPQAILRKIDLESLTAVKDSFVEKELRQHFSDLLYTVRHQEDRLYLYLLFEHKSYPDPWVGLQLLRYLVRIWEQHRKQHPKEGKLPAVVPLVLYHGRQKWCISDQFSSLIAQDNTELLQFIPDFRWQVYDLTVFSDKEIRGGVFGRITLLLLRHIFDPDLNSKLPKILSLLQEVGEKQDALEMLEVLLRYVVSATKTFNEDAVREVLNQSGVKEDFMQNFIDKYIEQGRNQGISQGQLVTLREAVMDILEVRFGNIASGIKKKISTCADLKRLKEVHRQAVLIGSPDELDL
ncbi:MAG: Rpn family recombination-promoting nuclease/putative transposase [Candidatus Electrothrix sp. AU1_5]|nr:Rpn family recombination-promoting nuclease/putative transposase [Candidatus Electrothrix gigas]